MIQRKAQRVYLELTPEQQAIITDVQQKIETEEESEIIELAKRLRNAHRLGEAVLQETLATLHREREAQGLTLADVEQRTGIEESNFSKRGTSGQPNPSLTTLTTYAEALGKKLVIVLADK